MEELKEKYKHIKGWGIDANPLNDPTYPMKDAGLERGDANWERPERQNVKKEVLYSNERPALPAVVGETLPPRNLSGTIRRYAFRYSESRYRHWLPLLMADRINECEGIVDDIKRGRLPNIFAERGWKASWQYEKKRVLRNALIGAIASATIFLLIKNR